MKHSTFYKRKGKDCVYTTIKLTPHHTFLRDELGGKTYSHADTMPLSSPIPYLAEIPYKEAHAICKKHNRKTRRGMYTTDLLRACKTANLKIRRLSESDTRQLNGSRYTQTTVLNALKPTGKYLIWITGHFFAVIDGIVLDAMHSPRRRVKAIYEVM